MKTQKSKSTARRAPRPVRVPPPLMRGSEKFEGASVLPEFDGDLGILLWQSLRNVLLWVATEPAKRKGLFSAGAEEKRRTKLLSVDVEDSLRTPLAVLARLLADPAGADKKRVTSACQKIADWAESKGATATSLAFTQAAALVSNDARLSYEVGRLARQRAEYPRAETWFRRAILQGRQSGDWESYSLAFVGLGNLYMQRGNLPAAQRAHMRAFRASRRKGLRSVQAMALHDLFVVAKERNQVREAEEFAAGALKAYGPGHSRLPFFAHDVAAFWMDRGCYAPALTVLTALVPHFRGQKEQPAIFANIARAASEVQDRRRFEEAWQNAWEMNTAADYSEKSAVVFESLAISAAAMDEWDHAVEAAEKSVEVATVRAEPQVKASAEALLADIRERRLQPAQQDLSVESSDHTEALAANLARSLNAAVAAR